MGRRRVLIVLGSLSAVLAGCVEPEVPPDGGVDVSFSRIESGPQTHYQTTGREFLVLDSPSEWDDFWQRHAAEGGPRAPPIEFQKEFVLALLLGERRSGGYEIQVSSIEWSGSDYTVFYEERQPGNCPTTGALTYPFDIVHAARVNEATPAVLFELSKTVQRTC